MSNPPFTVEHMVMVVISDEQARIRQLAKDEHREEMIEFDMDKD